MTVHVIRVPDLGEGIAEVELVAWHVKPGDTVAEDQSLADVMTDKASVEIPSSVAGVVLALGAEVGQMMAVGSELIRIEPAGAAPVARRATGPTSAPGAVPAVSSASAKAGPLAAKTTAKTTAKTVAKAMPVPVAPAVVPPREPTSSRTDLRPIASPAVRVRAWELGINLHDVVATGTAGRVMQADIDAHQASGGAKGLAMATSVVAPMPRAVATPGATQAIKIIGLRRKIAQKMQESKRRIPHYTYVEEIDVGEVEALRERLNARWGAQRGRLTLLAFLIRALVAAVRDFPQVNAVFDDEAGVLTRHTSVHVGIATQTEMGLMVPVLRDAQAHDLWSAAAEVVRLAEAARSGKVVRAELLGSTITLTSLGRLGGISSTPVINYPEVAIVGVNRIVQRPVMREGAVVARPMMNLSSSFDHRVVDGAVAAAFVQCLRELLEHPATLFVD